MSPILMAADLAAITLLVALFLSRHRRRDLLVAYVGVNVGVLAVSSALSMMSASIGVGLGLFGVLSIIRLRSEELTQTEIVHYFAALALGLLGGLGSAQPMWSMALMALVLGAIAVADHPLLSLRTSRQDVLLDRAITDFTSLRAYVEHTLGLEVVNLSVRKLDLVNDTTLVSVTTAAAAPRPAEVAQVVSR